MKKVSAEKRLAFIRQDVATLLEQLPESVLRTPIDGYDDLGTVLSNIAIASDEEDQEPLHWLVTWFEVFTDDEEEGTETIATFDTKKQALDFMFDYSTKYPEHTLSYDEWQSNVDESGVTLVKKI